MASVVEVRESLEQAQVTKNGNVIELTIPYTVEYDGLDLFMTVDALVASDGVTTVPDSGTIEQGSSLTFFFKSSTARLLPDSKVVEVLVVYSTDPAFEAPTGDKRNINISFDGVSYEENTNKDKDGKTIVNAAGDIYPAEIKKTYYDEKITIGYTADVVDTATLAGLRGKINPADITLTVKGHTRTFAARTLKLVNAPVSTTTQKNDKGWDVKVELHYRADTWDRKLVNHGYKYKDANGDLVKPLDRDREPTGELIYLAADGTKLDTSSGPVDCTFVKDASGNYPRVDDENAGLATFLESIA